MSTESTTDLPTSLDEAVKEFRILAAQCASQERQIREFSDLANKLGAENAALREQGAARDAFYRDQIAGLSDHRDRLQRKCVALITRLSGIKEAIVAAEREAHDEAIKNPAPKIVPAEPGEDKALTQLVASFPPRDALNRAAGI